MRINSSLSAVVDVRKCDCKREPAHCHIEKHGRRVAQVWLDPVQIASGHSLDRSEVNVVYEFVSNNAYELKSQYEYNREYGADY